MGSIETLNPGERQLALDHLDLVFGAHSGDPTDFSRQLPHCYGPESMEHQYVIREQGRILALVGLFQRDWVIAGRTLRMVGVGGVSTHRAARNQGLMRKLMHHCVGVMRDQGAHLSWLQGHRLRYAWFGYELCGTLLHSRLRTGEVRGRAPCGAQFAPLLATDNAALDAAWALHEARSTRHLRPRADLHDYLRSWHTDPYVARSADGEFLGYLVHHPYSNSLMEVGASSPAQVVDLACDWVRHRNEDHVVYAAVGDPALSRELASVTGGNTRLIASGNWQVFDWPVVLEALCAERARTGPLVPGVLTLGIEEGPRLRISSDGAAFEVTPTTQAPDLSLTQLTAMRMLFGPLRPSEVVELPPSIQAFADQWCPLPLTWAKLDGV